jgi:hypothetical protein
MLIRNNQDVFAKNYYEYSGIYGFAYKKNALYIRKEIFDKYELTDEHIQKFLEEAETVYEKLADFFPEYNQRGGSSYHAVEIPWRYGGGYAYYGDKAHLSSWADPWTNAVFLEENLFASSLSRIDIGFPALACREAGRLFAMAASEADLYYDLPYVWDSELFAVLAEHYIASELTLINADGEIVTGAGREWEDPDYSYSQFFGGLVDKYGYKIISDTLKEVSTASPDVESRDRHPMILFIKFLSEKTGDYIELLD